MALLHDVEFWIAVAFVAFVIVLYRFAAKRIGGALDQRGQGIKRELEEAQRLREEAHALLAKHQHESNEAAAQAKAIIAQAEAEAGRLRTEAEREIETALKRREQLALDKIAQAEAAAVAEVRDTAVTVAIAAARQLVAGGLTEARRDQIVDQAIAELGKKLH
jgi:F-type H+-transporting ATPase subunit b